MLKRRKDKYSLILKLLGWGSSVWRIPWASPYNPSVSIYQTPVTGHLLFWSVQYLLHLLGIVLSSPHGAGGTASHIFLLPPPTPHCYRLSCGPSKSIRWSPNHPECDCIWRKGLKEMIKLRSFRFQLGLKWGHLVKGRKRSGHQSVPLKRQWKEELGWNRELGSGNSGWALRSVDCLSLWGVLNTTLGSLAEWSG